MTAIAQAVLSIGWLVLFLVFGVVAVIAVAGVAKTAMIRDDRSDQIGDGHS